MDILKFDLSKKLGEFKPMNAVNNGPIYKRHASDQFRTNFYDYKRANIPFARNHDASFCASYGGDFTVDITSIFPNFDADVNNPASYDFACTDEYILVTLEAGTKTFYRLGQRIEHEIKKHNTMPPKDYQKWAEICEHIILHYNEGWNNGFHHNITYWEIWNEPDLDDDNAPKKRTWGGTKQEFFNFFEVVSKHLKGRFPNLKIGGPALAWREDWANDFLAFVEEKKLPLDFFSWHIYCTTPEAMMEKQKRLGKMLDKYHLSNAEMILNEWNYVRGWGEDFIPSIKTIIGLKGASFSLACMIAGQKSRSAMMMYYDARPATFNGLFDFYTLQPLKGYYPFYWYGMFYGKTEVRPQNEVENVYSLCGADENGKTLSMLTFYEEDDTPAQKEITLDFGKSAKYEVYVVDENHNGELWKTTEHLTFMLTKYTCLLIKEI